MAPRKGSLFCERIAWTSRVEPSIRPCYTPRMSWPDLTELLSDLQVTHLSGPEHCQIEGVAYDSRKVLPGFLFVAVTGVHVDGHDFIEAALAAGARAILCEREPGAAVVPGAAQSPTIYKVRDSKIALSYVARRWYGRPDDDLGIIGITGTDGKSSTVWYTWQLLEMLERPAAFISTVAMNSSGNTQPNGLRQSTPEALELFGLLREAVDAGKEYAVIEATSHGLSLKSGRLAALAFQTAVVTNITHEHLEFHGSLENYVYDKANLFRKLKCAQRKALGSLPEAGSAIINAADAHALELMRAVLDAEQKPNPPRMYFYACVDRIPEKHRALPLALWADNIEDGPRGVSADFYFPTYSVPEAAGAPVSKAVHREHAAQAGYTRDETEHPTSDANRAAVESVRVHMKIPGTFTIENAMAAALAVHAHTGVRLRIILSRLSELVGVKGRMRVVDAGQPFSVLVDYAHTPGSFERVFPVFRQSCAGRLIAVFGSGGERDVEKRPIQGRIASEYADIVVLTNEDPRLEDPVSILDEIASGVGNPNCEVVKIVDRREAIHFALATAREGDSVVLLGKGHEQSVITRERKIPWDEETVAYELLAELGFKAAGRG